MKQTTVFRLQGIFELSAIVLYLLGAWGGMPWVMYLGGGMLVLDTLSTVLLRVMNPIYPLALAVLFGIFFTPWYQGVFWACLVFSLLGSPNSFRKVLAPERVLEDIPKQP